MNEGINVRENQLIHDRKLTILLSITPILPKAKRLFSILQTKEIMKNFSVQHEFNARVGKAGRMFDTCAWKGVGRGRAGTIDACTWKGQGRRETLTHRLCSFPTLAEVHKFPAFNILGMTHAQLDFIFF
jgi:hypothetical protein